MSRSTSNHARAAQKVFFSYLYFVMAHGISCLLHQLLPLLLSFFHLIFIDRIKRMKTGFEFYSDYRAAACYIVPHSNFISFQFFLLRTYKKLHKPSYNNALALLRIIIAAVWSHSSLAFNASRLVLTSHSYPFLLSLAVIWCVHFIFINEIENCLLLPHSSRFHHQLNEYV